MTDQLPTAASPGWHAVTPRIVARNASSLVEFLRDVFDAAGAFQSSAPTIVEIGDSKIMVSEAGERAPETAFLYVYVADVETAWRRAIDRGATSMEAPFDTPYGDRRCMVKDVWGNTWQIARRPRSNAV